MSARAVFFRLRGRRKPKRAGRLGGFTLIELMVAMVLGLVVIAGVISVFLANQQAYRTNQALGEVQDGSRTAFEMMARDIRNAGLTGCDASSGRVANVLANSPTGGGATTDWWANWNNSVIGYDSSDPALTTGTAPGNQVAGTASLQLIGAEGSGLSVKSDTEPGGTFVLNETNSDLQKGDVVIVCTPDHATIVQLTTGTSTGFTQTKGSGTPGNCTADLSYPTVCSSSSSYVFVANSQVSRLSPVDWYIGNSPAQVVNGSPVVGGHSLYRLSLVNNAGALTMTPSEMVRGVKNMQITYLQSGNTEFEPVANVTNWAQVTAVQVMLTLESTDQRAGTNGNSAQVLQRTFTATTTVRNRVN